MVCEFCYFPLDSTTCGLSSPPPKPVLGQPRPTHLDSTGAAGAPLGCASRPQDLGLPPRGGGDPGRCGPLGRRWPGWVADFRAADFESGWRVGSGEVGKWGSGVGALSFVSFWFEASLQNQTHELFFMLFPHGNLEVHTSRGFILQRIGEDRSLELEACWALASWASSRPRDFEASLGTTWALRPGFPGLPRAG